MPSLAELLREAQKAYRGAEGAMDAGLPMQGRATFLPYRDTLPGSVMNQREVAMPGLLASLVNAFTAPGRALRGTDPSFQPEQEAMNLAGMLNLGSLATGAVRRPGELGAIAAWHGSPHDIPLGRSMRMDKVGTGEGEQAYGHGLYVAENNDVSKNYLRAGRNVGFLNWDDATTLAKKALAQSRGDKMSAKEILTNLSNKTSGESMKMNALLARDAIERGDINSGLYKLELSHPDPLKEAATPLKPDDFLQWDLPLSQQPEKVRKALEMSDITNPSAWMEMQVKPTDTMQSVYFKLARELGGVGAGTKGEKAASDYLKKLGIPGIRYLDQGSRASSGGTLVGTWRGSQQNMQDAGRGDWFARVRVENRSVGFLNSPATAFKTSPPMPSKESAEAWAKNEIAGGTYNYVLFDEKLANIIGKE